MQFVHLLVQGKYKLVARNSYWQTSRRKCYSIEKKIGSLFLRVGRVLMDWHRFSVLCFRALCSSGAGMLMGSKYNHDVAAPWLLPDSPSLRGQSDQGARWMERKLKMKPTYRCSIIIVWNIVLRAKRNRLEIVPAATVDEIHIVYVERTPAGSRFDWSFVE